MIPYPLLRWTAEFVANHVPHEMQLSLAAVAVLALAGIGAVIWSRIRKAGQFRPVVPT
jgi:hypothetical protein